MAGDEPIETIHVNIPKTEKSMEIIGNMGEFGILIVIPDLTYVELLKLLKRNRELMINPDDRWKCKIKQSKE
jgi:hypothetical protein